MWPDDAVETFKRHAEYKPGTGVGKNEYHGCSHSTKQKLIMYSHLHVIKLCHQS